MGEGAAISIDAWLQQARTWGTPLHHAVYNGDAARTRVLLRLGASLDCCWQPGAPSPIDLARQAGMHQPAARMVVLAASPWSTVNAQLFPTLVRARAFALGKVGRQLAVAFGGEREEHALWELWLECVMPLCLNRSSPALVDRDCLPSMPTKDAPEVSKSKLAIDSPTELRQLCDAGQPRGATLLAVRAAGGMEVDEAGLATTSGCKHNPEISPPLHWDEDF